MVRQPKMLLYLEKSPDLGLGVVYACNPTWAGSIDRTILVGGQPWKKVKDPTRKIT
jgi:hypothetical protein